MNTRVIRRNIASIALVAGTTFGGVTAMAVPAQAAPSVANTVTQRRPMNGYWRRVGIFNSRRACEYAARRYHGRYQCRQHGHRYELYVWMRRH